MAPRFTATSGGGSSAMLRSESPFASAPQHEKCKFDRRSSLPATMESSWARKARHVATNGATKLIRSLSLPNDVAVSPRSGRRKTSWIVASHRGHIPIYAAFACGVFMLYKICSDGDYSFLLTLSSIISSFSFGLVLLKVLTTGATGISVKMLHCYQLVTAARLSSILIFSGYLPYDSSGNVLYRVSEIMGFLLCTITCWIVRSQSKEHRKEISQMRLLTLAAATTAVCFHLTLNKFFLTDSTWAFGLYLEAVAVLPQLFLFYKEKKVEPTITHFLFSQAVSKSLSFTFWLTVYRELNRFGFSLIPGLSVYIGYFVMAVQVGQLLIMADFVIAYLRALIKGVPIDVLLNVSDYV